MMQDFIVSSVFPRLKYFRSVSVNREFLMYGTSLFPYKAYCKFQDVSRSMQNLFKYICTVQAIHEQTVQQNKYLIQNHFLTL